MGRGLQTAPPNNIKHTTITGRVGNVAKLLYRQSHNSQTLEDYSGQEETDSASGVSGTWAALQW